MADCAIHAATRATFTCGRCGAFGCAACSSVDGLCVACAERTAAFTAGSVQAGSLIADSFKLTLVNGWRAAAFAVLVVAANTATSLLLGLVPTPQAQLVVAFAVGMPAAVATSTIAQAAWVCLIASGVRGEQITIGAALRGGLGRAWPLFLCNLVAGLCIAVGAMLCLVPGILLALWWCLAAPAVVLGGSGPIDALTDSSRLGEGSRLSLLGAFVVTFLFVAAAGIVIGVAQQGVLYALRQHVSEDTVGKLLVILNLPVQVITTLATVPLITVPVLAYLRLSRREQLANL